jgi:hypothetical protein
LITVIFYSTLKITKAHSFNLKPLLPSSPLSPFIINRNSRLDTRG